VAKSNPRSTRGLRGNRSTRPTTTGRPALAQSKTDVAFLYIESSALLAALLERDVSARAALRAQGQRVTSALTIAEASRAIVRARLTGRLEPDEERAAIRALKTFERRCAIISVTHDVLMRAGRRFPVEPIPTLDAIHLATAELLGEAPQLVSVVTRDARVRDNAQALGYVVA
jgi:predicted nucleic acid-binding protein